MLAYTSYYAGPITHGNETERADLPERLHHQLVKTGKETGGWKGVDSYVHPWENVPPAHGGAKTVDRTKLSQTLPFPPHLPHVAALTRPV